MGVEAAAEAAAEVRRRRGEAAKLESWLRGRGFGDAADVAIAAAWAGEELPTGEGQDDADDAEVAEGAEE